MAEGGVMAGEIDLDAFKKLFIAKATACLQHQQETVRSEDEYRDDQRTVHFVARERRVAKMNEQQLFPLHALAPKTRKGAELTQCCASCLSTAQEGHCRGRDSKSNDAKQGDT
jgi:hypothetical protein